MQQDKHQNNSSETDLYKALASTSPIYCESAHKERKLPKMLQKQSKAAPKLAPNQVKIKSEPGLKLIQIKARFKPETKSKIKYYREQTR